MIFGRQVHIAKCIAFLFSENLQTLGARRDDRPYLFLLLAY